MTLEARAGAEARRGERGIFSFVEILIATLILALSATATAYWVETVSHLSNDADEQTIGSSLVKIVEGVLGPKAFHEPNATTWGPETGETLATYDDIDDFNGLVSSPPFDAALNTMPDAAWKVRITVENYSSTATGPVLMPGSTSSTADLRGITVVVEHNTREIARGFWLRARSPFE